MSMSRANASAKLPGCRMSAAILRHPAYIEWPADPRDRLPLTLWTRSIAEAVGGTASHDFQVAGVEMDSRDVVNGDLFIALKGEAMDGHRFLDKAFANGAAGAIVDRPVDWPAHPGRGYHRALEALAAAARSRVEATIIGVTGSVGKTGVKEAIFASARTRQPRRGASFDPQLQQPCRRSAQPCPDARAQPFRHVRDGHEPRGRDRGSDDAGPPACRRHHHDRPRAYREPRQHGCDRRCQGGDFRRARAGRHRGHPRRQRALRTR